MLSTNSLICREQLRDLPGLLFVLSSLPQIASAPAGVPDGPCVTIGVTGPELDAVARDYIESTGLEGCYQHALSHGIDTLGVAPLAMASRTSDTVFQAGNTISVEPGIYQPGITGCRIEDILGRSRTTRSAT